MLRIKSIFDGEGVLEARFLLAKTWIQGSKEKLELVCWKIFDLFSFKQSGLFPYETDTNWNKFFIILNQIAIIDL